ncbi:type IV toxin-antitoxin system AbiEi family antitoxin [Leucobacter sp. HY1910]
MDLTLAEDLQSRLHEYGLELRMGVTLENLEPGAVVHGELRYRGSTLRGNLSYVPEMTASTVAKTADFHQLDAPLLVVGDRVTERSADIMRERGINYMDGSGNAYINFEPVLIDVRGRRPSTPAAAGQNTRTRNVVHQRGGINLMSPKRAQVIFALLSWEFLLESPLRELARVACVSLGQAQSTLQLLREQGFLAHRQGFSETMRERLLDLWVQSYPAGLGRGQLRATFFGDITVTESRESPVFISGESALRTHMRPETLTLYSHGQPTELYISLRWRREEARPNIFVKEQFWEDPHGHSSGGVFTAPPLLVYADLLAAQDSRQHEVALEFRELHAQLRAD